MKTSLGNDGKLSRKQLTRLGGLIALVGGRTPYDHILEELVDLGFVQSDGQNITLSETGMNELLRLTAMAGLRPEQYTGHAEFTLPTKPELG
jgi:hypothetical protein